MSVTRHMPDNSPGPTGSAYLGYPRGVWPSLLSSFCVDPLPTNLRHSDCSVPGCVCPCHIRRDSHATWKLESRGVLPINNSQEFNPSGESVGLVEKLERLGSSRDSTRVFPGKDDRFMPSAKKACRRLSSKISQLTEVSFGMHHRSTIQPVRHWQGLKEVLTTHGHRNSPVHSPEFPSFHEADTQSLF